MPCRISIDREWTLPQNPDCIGEDEMGDYERLLDALRSGDKFGSTIHRMFGVPEIVQGDMQLECELVANGLYCGDATGYNDPRRKELENRALDWLLLLQIDSDDDGARWMWGDSGRIYYWIRQQDLKSLRFEHTQLILQCF